MSHQSLLADYRSGSEILKAALAGLSIDEWDACPGPGDWSILEVVCHLSDSEALFSERMKRVLVEDRPPLPYANESDCVKVLACGSRNPHDEAALIGGLRLQMARILEAQPDSAWGRVGVHSIQGDQTLAQLVQKAVNHLDHHIAFIKRKRDTLARV